MKTISIRTIARHCYGLNRKKTTRRLTSFVKELKKKYGRIVLVPVLLVLVGLNGWGQLYPVYQNVPMRVKMDSAKAIIIKDKLWSLNFWNDSTMAEPESWLTYSSDSSIAIKGDTMRAVRYLVEYLLWTQQKYYESLNVLERINLQALQRLAFKEDIDFIRRMNKYLENINKPFPH